MRWPTASSLACKQRPATRAPDAEAGISDQGHGCSPSQSFPAVEGRRRGTGGRDGHPRGVRDRPEPAAQPSPAGGPDRRLSVVRRSATTARRGLDDLRLPGRSWSCPATPYPDRGLEFLRSPASGGTAGLWLPYGSYLRRGTAQARAGPVLETDRGVLAADAARSLQPAGQWASGRSGRFALRRRPAGLVLCRPRARRSTHGLDAFALGGDPGARIRHLRTVADKWVASLGYRLARHRRL